MWSFVELASMDSCNEDGWKKTEMRKTRNTKKKMMTEDHEDNNQVIDKDLLTLCEVHLAPVSRAQ